MSEVPKTMVLLLSLNLGLLAVLLFLHFHKSPYTATQPQMYNINDNEAKPFVVFNKDYVDVSFSDPSFIEPINPDELTYEQRMKKINLCKPFLREYVETDVSYNPEISGDFPSYIPVFKERANAIGYEYDSKKYKEIIAKDWADYNPLRVLGYYSEEIPVEMYNANPTVQRDFSMPHLGLFNDDNYCDVHDNFVLNNPEVVLNKSYFLSDYHQFSIPRMAALAYKGKDTNPQVSKNMKSINFFQRLYPIDVRTSLFYFKLASFHHYHAIGKHFACWGQAYNHIPGHGHLIRKDLLVTSANDYIKKYREAKQEQCFSEGTYFPLSFRLYDEQECKAYFRLIETEQHKADSQVSEVQYVLKVGFGVHRGAGVYLVDTQTENRLKANYSNGDLCGKITDNLVTQKYIYDVMTIDDVKEKGGYKFDFRIYMLVVSVDPLIVYYHDGFLRVSLFRYSLKNLDPRSHLTNTEIAKEIFKKVEDGQLHEGMNSTQLRDFQMRTLGQFQDYLTTVDPVRYKDFVDNKLRTEFKRAYLHLAKMIQKKVTRRSTFFEVFGVDFIMDRNDKIYIVEVNPSPMMVGTSTTKTELMKSLNRGVVQIVTAYLRSRFKRTYDFIQKHKQRIMRRENLAELKTEFRKLDKNYLEPEFEKELASLSWQPVLDENQKGTPGYVNGLLTPDCLKSMEAVDQLS